MEDCIFCKIVKGDLPATFEFKGKSVVAFRDIKPVTPIHILIIPKKHIQRLAEAKNIDKELLGEIQLTAGEVARKLGVDAFRLITSNGSKAGQVVDHLHYHLLAGWKKSSKKMECEPGSLRNKK